MDMFKIWRDGVMDVDSHVVGFPVVFITKNGVGGMLYVSPTERDAPESYYTGFAVASRSLLE